MATSSGFPVGRNEPLLRSVRASATGVASPSSRANAFSPLKPSVATLARLWAVISCRRSQ
jgi:hypothetical protein